MLAADGTFVALGVLSQPLGGRYDPTTALIPGGPIAKVASAIMKSIDKDMKADVEELGDVDFAAEIAAWLTAVLPGCCVARAQ